MTTLVEIDPTWDELIDRVAQGEEITLTRDGTPVVELHRASVFNGAYFRRVRIRTGRPHSAAVTIRQMRDSGY